MKATGEEWKLDWYNTRGGRTIIKPTMCDELTLRDIVGVVGLHGSAPKRFVKKKKTNLFKPLIDKGYNCTLITVEGKTYTLNRLAAHNQIKKIVGHSAFTVEYIKVKLDI